MPARLAPRRLGAALAAHRPSLAALAGALVLVLLATLAPIATARTNAATDAPTLTPEEVAAEQRLFDLLARDRAQLGLVPYRRDARLQALARERSAEMVALGELSHTTADGGMVFDRFDDAGIRWFAAGEVIARNLTADVSMSAAMAYASWVNSPTHRDILRADDMNYLGVGVATDPVSGRRYWTAVVLRGPDRSGAIGRMRSASRIDRTSTRGLVAIRWGGSDLRLQVLTAGLRDYQVQRRREGGSWVTIRSGTTSTRLTQWLPRGVRYEYRVRARDRKGTFGAWSVPVGVRG